MSLVESGFALSLTIFKIKLRDEADYLLSHDVFSKAKKIDDCIGPSNDECFGPCAGIGTITQRHITEVNRITVVEWLYQLIDDPHIFCLTVHLLDFLLSRIQVRKGTHFQLLASTCYLITCKYHDVSIPDIDYIVRSTDNSFSAQCLLQEERRVLAVLGYTLPLLTTRTYFLAFLMQCFNSNEREQVMAQYMLDIITTYSYHCHSLRMSVVACAIMHYVRQLVPPFVWNHAATVPTTLHSVAAATNTVWPLYIENITGLAEEDLIPIVQLVRQIHYEYVSKHCRSAPFIHDKYNCKDRHFVSSMLVPFPTNDSLMFDCHRPRSRSLSRGHSMSQNVNDVTAPLDDCDSEVCPSSDCSSDSSSMAGSRASGVAVRKGEFSRSVSMELSSEVATVTEAEGLVEPAVGIDAGKRGVKRLASDATLTAAAGAAKPRPEPAVATFASRSTEGAAIAAVVKGSSSLGKRSLSLNSATAFVAVVATDALKPGAGTIAGSCAVVPGLKRSVSQGLISAYYPTSAATVVANGTVGAVGQDVAGVGQSVLPPPQGGKMQTNARLNRIRSQISGQQQTISAATAASAASSFVL
jgi:hypothetical protein